MFKLGLVTYNMANEWDVPTLIDMCRRTGFEAVELRTTHAHGVEPSLSPAERDAARRQFEGSGVRLVSLGTTCEYDSPDPETVSRHIAETGEFARLARDLGCLGIKVRPNALHEQQGVPPEQTLTQIGRALAECGESARELGVEIWVEVHGARTQIPANMRTIMEAADHPNVFVCWNSNPTDVVDGSVRASFELLQPWVRSVHITDLTNEAYPWRELFGLLRGSGYDRYTLAEIPGSSDPERVLRYYRALWQELAR
jgi:sugar phosphate isomerase/epimerase